MKKLLVLIATLLLLGGGFALANRTAACRRLTNLVANNGIPTTTFDFEGEAARIHELEALWENSEGAQKERLGLLLDQRLRFVGMWLGFYGISDEALDDFLYN